jgi:hypothetical protein
MISLADLRPGDLMFGPIGGIVPGIFPVGVGQAMLGELFDVGQLKVRHVGIVVQARTERLSRNDGPRLVQAMPHGAEEIEMSPATHWTPRHAYVRLPEDYPGQAEDAAAIARLFVSEKIPYSFASYAALAAWKWGIKTPRLERWIDRRCEPCPASPVIHRKGPWPGQLFTACLPAEAICSVLADQAWSLAGKRVMQGVAHQAVTPGALAGQLLGREGATWILPGRTA